MLSLLAEVDPAPVKEVVLSPHWVSFILTLLLPVLVALVTKASVSDRVRAVLLMILVAVNVLITNAITDTGTAVFSKEMFLEWLINLAVAVFAYLGFWKPVTQVNARAMPEVGIGPPAPKPQP